MEVMEFLQQSKKGFLKKVDDGVITEILARG